MSVPKGELLRVLGTKDVLALGFGAMIGWGWIVLAGGWVQSAGALGAIAAFALGGVAIILIGLVYAELASAMPQVGGEHVYSFRALGAVGSFVCTWAIILGYASVVAFEAVALPTVVEHLFPNYKVGYLWSVAGWDVYASWVAVGAGGAVAMTVINYFGISTAALLQKVVTVLILAVGLMFFTGALFEGSFQTMEPLFVDGAKGVLAVLIMVPFMFVGFDVIPQAAEEINLPFKLIGKLIVVSVAMAVAWYIMIIFGLSLALPQSQLGNSSLAVPDAMDVIFGGVWAGKLMVMAGVAGIITSWNAFLVGGSRAIYALAHARMLPLFLAKLHPKYNTPTNAILLLGGLSMLAPLAGRKSMVWLVDAGGLGIVIAYAMVALSFLVLRKREPDLVRPYRLPWGKLVGGFALLFSVMLGFMYMPGSPSALLWPHEWAIFLGWMLTGVVLYSFARYRYGAESTEKIMREEMQES